MKSYSNGLVFFGFMIFAANALASGSFVRGRNLKDALAMRSFHHDLGAVQVCEAGVPLGSRINATRMRNGDVLVTGYGDDGSKVATLYDLASGTFKSTAPSNDLHAGTSSTLLYNDQVLFVGGCKLPSGPCDNAELYNPVANTYTYTGTMLEGRSGAQVTTLMGGKVLITGGCGGDYCRHALASAEVYDPDTGVFTATGSMHVAREDHTATLLPNGKVLIVGGLARPDDMNGEIVSSAEVYDPDTGEFTLTGSLHQIRTEHSATLLYNDKVLITGGRTYNLDWGQGIYLATSELYDYTTGEFTSTGSMQTARDYFSSSLLGNGKVMIVGGATDQDYSSATEIYNPATGAFTAGPSMQVARMAPTSIALLNGRVLVLTGFNREGYANPVVEILEPPVRFLEKFLGINFP